MWTQLLSNCRDLLSTIIPCCFLFVSKISSILLWDKKEKGREEGRKEKKEEGRVEGGLSSISIFHVFRKETSVCFLEENTISHRSLILPKEEAICWNNDVWRKVTLTHSNKCLVVGFGGRGRTLTFSLGQFPWCKHLQPSWFQATEIRPTRQQNSWKLNIHLPWAVMWLQHINTHIKWLWGPQSPAVNRPQNSSVLPLLRLFSERHFLFPWGT